MKKTLFKAFFFLFLFGLGLYLPYIGGKEFQGEEGRRVLIALEMIEKKEYLIPQILGEPYYNKPPLFNLALAFYLKLMGDYSETTARSFSALCLIFTALFLVYIWSLILRALKDISLSLSLILLPGLIFLTTPEVIDKALRAEIDAFYTMVITLGIFGWFYLYEIKNRKIFGFLFLGFFLGLGILTKTFQGLIFFYLAYVPYLIFQRRLKELFQTPHLIGLLSTFFVFLAWAWPVSLKVGLKPFIVSWIQEYFIAAKAQEMPFLQHLESFTLSALLGLSPWIVFLIFFSLKLYQLLFILKYSPLLYRLFLFSFFLFVFSYFFHFLFPGARFRYILPSISGFIFLVTLSFYGFLNLSLEERPLKFLKLLLGRILPLLSLIIAFSFHFYFSTYPFLLSFLFYLFHISFILLNVIILLIHKISLKVFFYYLVFYVFIVKQLFVYFYYPFHQKEMNYFRKAALEIADLIKDKKEIYLCQTTPHHLIYYLKYRYKLIERIEYLKTCEILPQGAYILFLGNYSLEGASLIEKVYFLKIRKKTYFLVKTRG